MIELILTCTVLTAFSFWVCRWADRVSYDKVHPYINITVTNFDMLELKELVFRLHKEAEELFRLK